MNKSAFVIALLLVSACFSLKIEKKNKAQKLAMQAPTLHQDPIQHERVKVTAQKHTAEHMMADLNTPTRHENVAKKQAASVRSSGSISIKAQKVTGFEEA